MNIYPLSTVGLSMEKSLTYDGQRHSKKQVSSQVIFFSICSYNFCLIFACFISGRFWELSEISAKKIIYFFLFVIKKEDTCFRNDSFLHTILTFNDINKLDETYVFCLIIDIQIANEEYTHIAVASLKKQVVTHCILFHNKVEFSGIPHLKLDLTLEVLLNLYFCFHRTWNCHHNSWIQWYTDCQAYSLFKRW